MVQIKIYHEDVEITTSDGSVYAIARDCVADVRKATELILQLPTTPAFDVIDIKLQ